MAEGFPIEARNRFAIARGGLVAQPFLRSQVYSYVTGAGTSVQFGTTQSRAFGSHGLEMYVSVPLAAGLNNGAQVRFRFRGNTLGLAYATNAQQPLGCRIDGVAYPVPSPGEIDLDTQGVTGAYDTLPGVIVATDLSDEPHYCVLDFPGDPLAATNFIWYMYGYLVDSAAGYQPLEPGARAAAITPILTTTVTALSAISGVASSATVIGAISFIFVNSSAAVVIVSLQPPGTGSVAIPIQVPANGYAQFTPAGGRPVYDYLAWKVGASVGSTTTMTIIGSF